MSKQKPLTRGARAQFFRDGHELHSACDIPVAGAFAVRSLPPGQYTVRDSCGGEQNINVTPLAEWTTILDGDVPGVTSGPASSGVIESSPLRVGPGGGVLGHPDQVAPGANVTDRIRAGATGEVPAETPAPIPAAERPSLRPKDPTSEERVSGQAGAPIVQDAPIRSVADMLKEARRRTKLGEEDEDARLEEQIAAEDAGVPVPTVVVPPDMGPEPLEPTFVEDEAA